MAAVPALLSLIHQRCVLPSSLEYMKDTPATRSVGVSFSLFCVGTYGIQNDDHVDVCGSRKQKRHQPQEQLSQMYLSPLMVRLEGVQIDKSHIM